MSSEFNGLSDSSQSQKEARTVFKTIRNIDKEIDQKDLAALLVATSANDIEFENGKLCPKYA